MLTEVRKEQIALMDEKKNLQEEKERFEIKKDIVSFADFCRDVINKSGSYEAPSDWENQKRYLDKLFKKLTDKMSMINNNTKNVPMNQGR